MPAASPPTARRSIRASSRSALENMFIVEKLAADNMRIRLAGMKICEMMGMEVHGMQPGFLIDEPTGCASTASSTW